MHVHLHLTPAAAWPTCVPQPNSQLRRGLVRAVDPGSARPVLGRLSGAQHVVPKRGSRSLQQPQLALEASGRSLQPLPPARHQRRPARLSCNFNSSQCSTFSGSRPSYWLCSAQCRAPGTCETPQALAPTPGLQTCRQHGQQALRRTTEALLKAKTPPRQALALQT